ncbi:hypothetical protein UFOVP16_14 [uncultured Caudovirales phage]|uniref:Uncharacterized protein n=1 Tax=uncultured Caudovirales phage TaxID=2100421 RepID=A0A6J5KL19_9CAUD|nr:hypothetical protein UFOVP16_14 [uncultured Caudovirales phage]
MIYETVKEAADANGVTINGVYCALHRGNLDGLGLGKTKPTPVTLAGVTFRSMNAASVALGFSRARLREMLLHGGAKARERVHATARDYAATLGNNPQIRGEE